MKKLILAVLTLLLATIVSAEPYVMVKGGAQFSHFSFDYSESLFGVRGGIGGYIPLGESSFCLMPQAVYAQKGQETGDFLGKCTIHYAEVPLTIGALVKFNKNIKLGLMAGPYFAFGVAGKNLNTDLMRIDIFDVLGRFDAGLNAGIQFHIWKIFVFADYDFGLHNLVKKEYSEFCSDFTTRSGAVGIGVAF